MGELPSDINFNILSRTPIKYLARFQCVSRICSDYADSYFATNHAKRNTEEPTLVMFHQFPGDLPNLPCTLSFPRIIESKEDIVALEVSKNPVMEFCIKGSSSRFPVDMVLGSCNGLLYSSQHHLNGEITFVVIQPLKKECYVLPPIKIYSDVQTFARELSGLGFDDSTNTFKMVCVLVRDQVYPSNTDLVMEKICTMVHDLGTDSWRKIPQIPSYPITGESVFAGGCLHWLVGSDVVYSQTNEFGEKIIWFDLRKEEFGLIDTPKHTRGYCWINQHLVDLDGEVGFVYNDVDTSIEVWVLKKKNWVMHCRFYQNTALVPTGPIKVLGYWNKDGDILMTTPEHKQLFVYNLKNAVLHEANICGLKDGCETDFRMYQRSLFSLRHKSINAC